MTNQQDPIKLALEALRQARISHYRTDNVHRGKTWGKTAQKMEVAFTALDAIPQPAPVPADAELDALRQDIVSECVNSEIDRLLAGRILVALSALRTRLAEVKGAQTHAARDVLAERARQISAEDWTPENDDAYQSGDLANAASCYAATNPAMSTDRNAPWIWPWAASWWKPTNRRRDLVKAGALILAEIERLDRRFNSNKDATK